MNIKSQKDFFSGLMFMGVGVAFAWGSLEYPIGRSSNMGAGYFPLVLGVVLALLGLAITFKALVVETVDGEKLGKLALKPLFFIITANLVFGAAIGGLPRIGLPAIGLVPAIFILVAVASMAEADWQFLPIWLGGFLGLVLGGFVVSVLAPALVTASTPITYFSQDKMDVYPKLFGAWTWGAYLGGRFIAFFAAAFAFLKWAPVSKEYKEYAVLTAALIAISVWTFVELIRVQIAVWPDIASIFARGSHGVI